MEFRTRLRDLGTPVVVECAGADPLVVLEFDRRAPRDVARHGPGEHGTRVRVTTMGNADPEFVGDVSPEMELGDFAALHLTDKPLRAFGLPPGRIETLHNLRMGLARSGTVLLSLSTIVFIVLFVPVETVRALLIALMVAIAIVAVAAHPRSLRAARHVYRSDSGTYPLAELLDERPALQAASDAVADIKEEYGRLLCDVVVRIEQPALFDPAVETTRRFTAALIQWDDGAEVLDAAAKSTLAARVRLTFGAAREHAVAVGMDHLPPDAREAAQRAAKALRLATHTTNAGEREAALSRGLEILDSLMLYYLPHGSQARAMIAGRPVLALPGRRSSRGES